MFQKLIIILFFLFASFVAAAENLTLQDIEKYLNSIRTFKADFSQEDSLGNNGKGMIYLQKPNLFRIENFEPFHTVMIGNKSLIIYHDYELGETSHGNADNGAINLLVADQVKFNGSKIEVKSFKNYFNIMEIEFYDKSQRDLGSMTMVFTKDPIELKQIRTQKDNNKMIMNLYNREINREINKKQFVFTYPKVQTPYPSQ